MKPTLLLYVLIFYASPPLVWPQNQCQKDRLKDVKSGETNVHGTNLGSWFILENGMAPRLWDDNGCNRNTQQGSYLLEQCLGDRAESVMKQHWSNWITEDDFEELSKYGVNIARLPVGWWQIYDLEGGVQNANYSITPPQEYVVGGLHYIDQVLDWGEKYGIGIIVDMHSAPGSQNGNEHSSPAELGGIYWDKYSDNVDQTIESVRLYAERYTNRPALFGFALLNEPERVDVGVMQDYYVRAYNEIRKASPESWVVISPRNNPYEWGTESQWTGFMNPDQGYTKVAMDIHLYSCFGGPADKTNADDAINYIKNDRRSQINNFKDRNPKGLLVGEWSACGHFPVERAGEFAQAQVDVYSTASLGWTFWSWTDGAPGNTWSMQTAFESGWIKPQYPC